LKEKNSLEINKNIIRMNNNFDEMN